MILVDAAAWLKNLEVGSWKLEIIAIELVESLSDKEL